MFVSSIFSFFVLFILCVSRSGSSSRLIIMAPKKKPHTTGEKPLSRRTVICGECSKQLERYERLKPHFETFHVGKHPYEKGQKTFSFSSPTSTKRKKYLIIVPSFCNKKLQTSKKSLIFKVTFPRNKAWEGHFIPIWRVQNPGCAPA